MKNWKTYVRNSYSKRFLRFSILAFFLAVVPMPFSTACGPYNYAFEGYSFLNPNLINLESQLVPFYLNFDVLAKHYEGPESVQLKENAKEWQERFCDIPKLADIEAILYNTSITRLRDLRNAVRDKTASLPRSLSSNTFARHLKRERCFETANYLVFAKSCEPFVTRKDPWERKQPKKEGMQELIDIGLENIRDRRIKSHYIKLRYAYQVIRLAHYKKDYKRTIKLYEDLTPKLESDSSILDYWNLAHYAGALQSTKQRVKAAYLFSLVFENCPSKRDQAYQSFSIRTNKQWQDCLNLCKNDRERVTLYAIRANSSKSRVLEEMKNIYDLEPTSRHLKLLLFREIKRLEKDLLGLEFNDKQKDNKQLFQIPRKFAGSYVIEFQKFVRKVAREKRITEPSLWLLAEGYLELLSGDFYHAKETFDEARALIDNPQLQEQLNVFELARTISALQKPVPSVEQLVDSIRRNSPAVFRKYNDFPDFISDKMANLYEENNALGKAFLVQYDWREIRPNPRIDILNDIIELTDKEQLELTDLERYLLDKSSSSETIRNDIYDAKAVSLMNRYEFGAALRTLQEIGERAVSNDYGTFKPFVEQINDCVNCDYPDTLVFTRHRLLEQLIELKDKVEAKNADSYFYAYQMGLALYNMSYFGPAWKAMDYYRSGASLNPYNLQDGDYIIEDWKFPYGNYEHMDCTEALKYFEIAREQSPDKELAAKATFMAAKCEQNFHFLGQAPRTFYYFNDLIANYNDTDYFKEIIEECEYFMIYANQ